MRQPGDPPPVVELAPAGILTCDECGQDTTVRFIVDSGGRWNLPMGICCPICNQRNEIDIHAFVKLLQMNFRP